MTAAATPHGLAELLVNMRAPRDVQALPDCQLPGLAREVRRQLIDTVTATGGHLGAGLGTVELIIALNRVFHSPRDVIVFDIGHQTYPHKLLTGRARMFTSLRQAGGLSGYPSRAESAHDCIENSHASVSLAWVDGIAKALALRGQRQRRVVAVIGDGALTGGVAWEGLNNLGGSDRPVIVVLNDNGRSYDPTTGAIATHLKQLRHGSSQELNLFENLGFAYIGPVDGHDIDATCNALRHAQTTTRPVIVHAVTEKGRGYPPAEADENDRMHACGVVDPVTGHPTTRRRTSWTDVFEDEIVRIAERQPNLVAMTAAMRLPTGLGAFSSRFPDRVFDSGIAEQHLLASAAGAAAMGLHPCVVLYSTFLHRGFDQLLLDIGLHHLAVTLVIDRAGITGPDGPSHHGMWDLALLTCVPGLHVGCPRDPNRLREQLRDALAMTQPTAIRYPKGHVSHDITAVEQINGLDILHRSHGRHDVLLTAIGAMAQPCVEAERQLRRDGIGATVVDPQWVWPLNPHLIELASHYRVAVCVEDGIAEAGIGAHLVQAMARAHPQTSTRALGLPVAYIPHANREQILARHGLTGSAISATCQTMLNTTNLTKPRQPPKRRTK
jgi:1-deoxy-D-xylulose-5-phosphate synthase